jgi:hypothetical protein
MTHGTLYNEEQSSNISNLELVHYAQEGSTCTCTCTSQRTQSVVITQTNQLVQNGEIISAYSEIHMKHINLEADYLLHTVNTVAGSNILPILTQ